MPEQLPLEEGISPDPSWLYTVFGDNSMYTTTNPVAPVSAARWNRVLIPQMQPRSLFYPDSYATAHQSCLERDGNPKVAVHDGPHQSSR